MIWIAVSTDWLYNSPMTEPVTVAKTSAIPDGQMKEFRIAGRVITVANVGGEYMAFDGICTHEHCSLAGGFLDGFTLTCYCHGAQFDIRKGDVLAPPAKEPLSVYPVSVDGDNIQVKF